MKLSKSIFLSVFTCFLLLNIAIADEARKKMYVDQSIFGSNESVLDYFNEENLHVSRSDPNSRYLELCDNFSYTYLSGKLFNNDYSYLGNDFIIIEGKSYCVKKTKNCIDEKIDHMLRVDNCDKPLDLYSFLDKKGGIVKLGVNDSLSAYHEWRNKDFKILNIDAHPFEVAFIDNQSEIFVYTQLLNNIKEIKNNDIYSLYFKPLFFFSILLFLFFVFSKHIPFIIYLTISALIGYGIGNHLHTRDYDRTERYLDRELRKLSSRKQQDKKAEFKSSYNEDEVIYSGTGAAFFMGKRCIGNCSGHIAGYEWAKENGISEKRGCEDGKSDSFIEGCMSHVDNIEEDAYFTDGYDYSGPDCTPGRYGTC